MEEVIDTESESLQEPSVAEADAHWEACADHQSGFQPAGRYGHSAVVCEDRMILFGGSQSDGQFCEDVAYWSLEKLAFTAPSNGVLNKSGRNFHSACAYGGKMYVFGGKANGYRNDLWAWDPLSQTWDQLNPTGLIPAARWGQAACIGDGKWFIHGGFDSGKKKKKKKLIFCLIFFF
jgi:N-acetylneuraminic acid mutarotase